MSKADDAKEAVFEAITVLANASKQASGNTKAAMVRDAAVAYRALVGGQQPGGVVVQSS